MSPDPLPKTGKKAQNHMQSCRIPRVITNITQGTGIQPLQVMPPREIDVLISPLCNILCLLHGGCGIHSMMMTGIMPVFQFRIELFPEPVGNRSQLLFRQIHCRHEPETAHRLRTTF